MVNLKKPNKVDNQEKETIFAYFTDFNRERN